MDQRADDFANAGSEPGREPDWAGRQQHQGAGDEFDVRQDAISVVWVCGVQSGESGQLHATGTAGLQHESGRAAQRGAGCVSGELGDIPVPAENLGRADADYERSGGGAGDGGGSERVAGGGGSGGSDWVIYEK